jgi:flagellar hook-length control protein FliK
LLNSIVGPPLKGVADFMSPEKPKADLSKGTKRAGSDSFGEVLSTRERDEIKPSRAEFQKPLREKAPTDKSERVEREATRRPESEDKAEKVTATREDGAKKESKGSSQRQNAILNFMDSFESEFGVPPTRIVEAMANLKPNDQVEAPEATADQVIDQLGLDDQQEDQAKEMYIGLLAQLAQIEKNPQAVPPPKVTPEAMLSGAAVTGGVAKDRVATEQARREVMNQGLDSMNQKFWMQKGSGIDGGTGAVKASGTELADKLAQMNLQEKMLQPQGLQVDESFLQTPQPPVPGTDKPMQGLEALDSEVTSTPEGALAAIIAAARAVKNGKAEEQGLKGTEEGSSEIEDTASFESSGIKAREGEALAKGEMPNVVNASQDSAKGFEFNKQQQEAFNQSPEKGAKAEIQAKTKNVEKNDFKKSLGMEGLQAQPLPSLKEGMLSGAAVAGAQAPVAPSKSENEANVRQIMNQAQYLIKKGGGEMKVEMTPEGMGKIHMKVVVQDGKVNVQMAADTQEAKKTLESGLSDLKNSLAAHKLSMDHIKIDVVAGTNTDSSTNNQTNQNNSGSRDQTQKFWNNFNDNFGSARQQRDNFADVPSLRGYARPRTDQVLEPIKSASVNKYAAAGKGKGLNLVA